jgi:hypothetical protein
MPCPCFLPSTQSPSNLPTPSHITPKDPHPAPAKPRQSTPRLHTSNALTQPPPRANTSCAHSHARTPLIPANTPMQHSPVFVGIGHYASSVPLVVAVGPFKAIPVRPRVDALSVLFAVDPVSFKSAHPVTYNPKRPPPSTRKPPSVTVPPRCTHALTQLQPRTNTLSSVLRRLASTPRHHTRHDTHAALTGFRRAR